MSDPQARIDELLVANNALVERARKAETEVARLQAILDRVAPAAAQGGTWPEIPHEGRTSQREGAKPGFNARVFGAPTLRRGALIDGDG